MFEDDNMDLGKVMKHYAQSNPHVSLSDIAFLMDVPYQPELEYDDSDIFEQK